MTPDTRNTDTHSANPHSDLIHQQLRAIVDAARERRAEDVVVLDLTDVSSTLEYFVICTATAGLQLNAVQENIREKAQEAGLPRPTVEGPSERWLLLAFGGSIVVHIMTKDAREYYDLEGLWSDARVLPFPEQAPNRTV
ncbi:ribosome silencing factor [Deinococcus metallilatus]|uniref:Ribosomal silencing factor RsfS n=1 Tax=Deinococcus metallilatus TaxID=1211322 RepID=A0ABR6MRU3_9DEIO|nr:ribosome silencing factor [Deinococcus metallilatus]MBB5294621.1 ribosome-associated protein [Deinococcus metallilatus]GMA15834.1 ribosomal silencing factor RsfS [Deinococcus metallilatus]